MIILNVAQGTFEWEQARLGMPTASAFDRIITPKTMKPSQSAVTYRNQILAEWFLGRPIDWSGQSGWMDRGRALEAEARAYYEMQRNVDVQTVGFVMRDDGEVGGSPDGLVGEDGGLEIKCPAIHTHIGYLLGEGADYHAQVQGYLYITGRKWWDVMSYNPDLPAKIVRVERDEAFITALDAVLNTFCEHLAKAKEQLGEHYQAHRAAPAEVAA